MITIEDISKIDNTNLNTYSYYVHGDYRKNERSYYINYPTSKKIFYGDLTEITLKNNLNNTPIDDLFLMPGYMTYSDYDNSCMVERSNFKLFMETYKEHDGIFEVYGGYGTTSIAISLKWLMDPKNKETAQEIIDLLNELNEYPCIDDGDMSNMEYDAFLEGLDSFKVEDCNSLLSKMYLVDVYDYDENKLRDVLIESDGRGNPSYIIESGGGCYIDTKELCSHVSLSDYYDCLTDYEFKGAI